eukprot:412048-Hanusia_phi.AAC.1
MNPNSIQPLPARPRQAFGRGRHLRGGGEEVKVQSEGVSVEYQGNLGQGAESFTDVVNYEYLDHTADVQFHSWGKTKEEAFEQAVVCMFSYITDLPTVELCATNTVEVTCGREGDER